MHIKRTCGPDSDPLSGWAQIQAGQATLTRDVLEQRGGTEIKSLRISPRVTASRCSAISSWCQLIFTGAGSNCGQAQAKNSISDPSQRSRSSAATSYSRPAAIFSARRGSSAAILARSSGLKLKRSAIVMIDRRRFEQPSGSCRLPMPVALRRSFSPTALLSSRHHYR